MKYQAVDKKCCLQHGEIYLDEEKQRVFTPKGVSHLSTKGIQILGIFAYPPKKVHSKAIRRQEIRWGRGLVQGFFQRPGPRRLNSCAAHQQALFKIRDFYSQSWIFSKEFIEMA